MAVVGRSELVIGYGRPIRVHGVHDDLIRVHSCPSVVKLTLIRVLRFQRLL